MKKSSAYGRTIELHLLPSSKKNSFVKKSSNLSVVESTYIHRRYEISLVGWLGDVIRDENERKIRDNLYEILNFFYIHPSLCTCKKQVPHIGWNFSFFHATTIECFCFICRKIFNEIFFLHLLQ